MLVSKNKSISKACKVADTVFSSLLKNMGGFRTEREVALFIKREIRSRGFRPAFEPIVASAGSGAEPHHKPKNLSLTRGFCVIDFGVRVRGYCSDLSRTVFFGEPKKSEVRLYNLVLASQKKAIKKLKAGVSGHFLWLLSFNALGEHKKKFVHGLGHGLGKKVHTKPFLKKNSKDVLAVGDVVTVEPGIYFKKKFGIRIEDDFLITKKGAKKLTKSTQKLLVFPVPKKS